MKCVRGGCLAVLIGVVTSVAAWAQPVKLGASTYFLSPRAADHAPPTASLRTEATAKFAAPTNQWYSTLIFNPVPDALFAHPLTFRPTPAGFEMALAGKEIVPTERRDVEVHYPHRDALLFSPVAFEPGPARLAKTSDWSIDIAMGNGSDQLTATIAHASPFAYFQLSRGDIRVKLPVPAQAHDAGADTRVLGLKLKGKVYAVFGPTGVRWEKVSAQEWIGHLPASATYFSAAALPDDKPETLKLFSRHAYAFIQDTRVDWRYLSAASKVETTFKVTTRVMEGQDNGPLIGLYPHQWFNNASVADRLGPAYDSIRGKIRLLAASDFKTELSYHGFVPYWPGVKEGPRLGELADVMGTDVRKRRELLPDKENRDNWRTSAYWQGKGLARLTQLMSVAEQQGDLEGRDRLLAMTKERLEYWFTGAGRSYFHLDRKLGTVVSYPDEFFAVEQMNDHHFHYGYWIRAAADVALRDPAWAARDKWGGMVELLTADIATSERGRSDFPFLRNFDPYEGHSWASGIGLGAFGNNQESSSEAVNAWAALILWGEVTGNTALRDLGIYLYATEVNSINHYWFDLQHQVFAPDYLNAEVSMVFGGKYAHNTWWTDEPRQIHGINLLPVSTYSTYLGRDPAFVKRNLGALKGESEVYAARGKLPPNPPPPDIWQDIFAKYLALADPVAALAQWDRWGSVELGDTRTHTLHWMLSLNQMGTPDFGVTADTALYSVFKRANGDRTYLAFNAGKAPMTVRFSDGKSLEVPPGTLARRD